MMSIGILILTKKQYGTFVYTALLYLSEFGEDFQGGEFVFIDKGKNQTIIPHPGLLSFFTSGSENVHCVQKVTQGIRYAWTVAFSCDPKSDVRKKLDKKLKLLLSRSV